MNSTIAKERMENCLQELDVIKKEVEKDSLSRVNKYLIQHAVVFSSACIEVAVKAIIADTVQKGVNTYAKTYTDRAIRNNSMNPSYSKIQSLMNEINLDWTKTMKEKLEEHSNKDRILTGINNIVKNRNGIAHGRGCTASINNVIDWADGCFELIKIIDSIVN